VTLFHLSLPLPPTGFFDDDNAIGGWNEPTQRDDAVNQITELAARVKTVRKSIERRLFFCFTHYVLTSYDRD
jgi:hypothetical protein